MTGVASVNDGHTFLAGGGKLEVATFRGHLRQLCLKTTTLSFSPPPIVNLSTTTTNWPFSISCRRPQITCSDLLLLMLLHGATPTSLHVDVMPAVDCRAVHL